MADPLDDNILQKLVHTPSKDSEEYDTSGQLVFFWQISTQFHFGRHEFDRRTPQPLAVNQKLRILIVIRFTQRSGLPNLTLPCL